MCSVENVRPCASVRMPAELTSAFSHRRHRRRREHSSGPGQTTRATYCINRPPDPSFLLSSCFTTATLILQANSGAAAAAPVAPAPAPVPAAAPEANSNDDDDAAEISSGGGSTSHGSGSGSGSGSGGGSSGDGDGGGGSGGEDDGDGDSVEMVKRVRNRGGGASSAAKQSECGEASGLINRSRFGNAHTLGSDLIGSTDQSYQSTPGRRPRPRLETNLIGWMLYTPHWIGLDWIGIGLDRVGSTGQSNHATCCAACSRITDKNEIRNPEMRVCPPCSALLWCALEHDHDRDDEIRKPTSKSTSTSTSAKSVHANQESSDRWFTNTHIAMVSILAALFNDLEERHSTTYGKVRRVHTPAEPLSKGPNTWEWARVLWVFVRRLGGAPLHHLRGKWHIDSKREREADRDEEEDGECHRAGGGRWCLCVVLRVGKPVLIYVCNLVSQRPNYYHTHHVSFAEGLVRRWEQGGSVSACGVRA